MKQDILKKSRKNRQSLNSSSMQETQKVRTASKFLIGRSQKSKMLSNVFVEFFLKINITIYYISFDKTPKNHQYDLNLLIELGQFSCNTVFYLCDNKLKWFVSYTCDRLTDNYLSNCSFSRHTLLSRIQEHALIYVAEAKVHAPKRIQICHFLRSGK